MPACNDQQLYVNISPDQILLLVSLMTGITCLLGAVGAAELFPHLVRNIVVSERYH